MIPVGPLFNHPHTYNPSSTSVGFPVVLLRTRPWIFGTMPGKEALIGKHDIWNFLKMAFDAHLRTTIDG